MRVSGDARRAVALPLGGVGAGQVALAADGTLRQWQQLPRPNHRGFVPDSFFALRVSGIEPPLDPRRVLQTAPVAPAAEPAPNQSDDEVPAQNAPPTATWPAMAASTFEGRYPYARVGFDDPAVPLDVTLEGMTPFVPLDADASGLPLARFAVALRNRGPIPVQGWLVATLQNSIGWDGTTPIDGPRCGLYGGNVNRVVRRGDTTAIVMDNPSLAEDDPRFGELALWTSAPAAVLPRFSTAADALRWADTLNLQGPSQTLDYSEASVRRSLKELVPRMVAPVGPSPGGQTWGGALALPFALQPGEETTLEVVHAWWLPGHDVDFDQFGPERGLAGSRLRLGRWSADRHGSALAVVDRFDAERDALLGASAEWAAATTRSDLPDAVRELLDVQAAHVRSPTFFRTSDGRFYGFEGGLGASTRNWNGDVGGSCPLTCTHVFNYEQALSRLFPSLAVTQREVELHHVLGPDGSLPHRVVLPLWMPQLHGQPIGGPSEPALDGMLGAVLKTYREARQGAGLDWLREQWEPLRRLMAHVTATWDTEGDGILRGRQPVTYDIDLHGPNMFVGGLWLAALRAMEEIARLLGDGGLAEGYAARFAVASAAYDALLFNGEYYAQPDTGAAYDFGAGCLSDQLLGQWWAHQLELGHLLPAEHVRSALRALVTHNLRRGFRGFEHGYRVFADADDTGLLVCTWPRGGRPEVPVRYCDEVWTGVEYQVAAHCLMEGLVDEGLELVEAVAGRYDGTRRNPYNHLECGDHYARTLAGWSVLEGLTGLRYDALRRRLAVASRPGTFPFVAGSGWGTIAVAADGAVTVACSGGVVDVDVLAVDGRERAFGGALAAGDWRVVRA